MNKGKPLVILLLTTCGFILNGCKKMLSEKPDNTQVVAESLEDIEGMMNDYYIMNQNTIALGEAAADDYFVSDVTFNSFEESLGNVYRWQMDAYYYENDWSLGYTAIFNSNYCLEKIENLPADKQNTQKGRFVKGAAHFYRAYWMLGLLWVHAKAYDSARAGIEKGIVLRTQSDYNQPSVRASVEDSYKQVIDDAKKAASLLPDAPPVHVAQPSKPAAYGVLARTYLSMRNYDSAARYAGLALAIKNDLLDYNDGAVRPGQNIPFSPLNAEIIFYSTMWPGYRCKNPTNALTDSLLYRSYDANDLRKTCFFRPKEGHQRFKGSYASATSTLFSGIATDELYLIQAECFARLGQVSKAMELLNSILEKRWVKGTFIPLALSDAKASLERVLLERRKELLFRGLRWADIKRLNKEDPAITPTRVILGNVFKLEPNSAKFALPLPKDIIDLTGIPQN